MRGGAVKRIEAALEEWSERSTGKQRITTSRAHWQLVEDGYEVAITTVRECLAERRRRDEEVHVPLQWWTGGCAQVDLFEVTVDTGGCGRRRGSP